MTGKYLEEDECKNKYHLGKVLEDGQLDCTYDKAKCMENLPLKEECPILDCEECTPCPDIPGSPELFIVSLPMPKDASASLSEHHLHIAEIAFTNVSGTSVSPLQCVESSKSTDRGCTLTFDGDATTINHTAEDSNAEIHLLQYKFAPGTSIGSVNITNRSDMQDRFLGANLMYIKNNQVVWSHQIREVAPSYTFQISESFLLQRPFTIPLWAWILLVVGIVCYFQKRQVQRG